MDCRLHSGSLTRVGLQLGRGGCPRRTTIQIALTDAEYRRRLAERLGETGHTPRCVERPELSVDEVLVVDADHLQTLPRPINNPDRVVMIADPADGDFSDAWNAGISSVVNRRDSLGTAVMAILSASLRTRRPPGGSGTILREALFPEAGS